MKIKEKLGIVRTSKEKEESIIKHGGNCFFKIVLYYR
jgi:hypothetical protein